MSFLQLVLSLDKTIRELILFCRQCHSDPYRNNLLLVSLDYENRENGTGGLFPSNVCTQKAIVICSITYPVISDEA